MNQYNHGKHLTRASAAGLSPSKSWVAWVSTFEEGRREHVPPFLKNGGGFPRLIKSAKDGDLVFYCLSVVYLITSPSGFNLPNQFQLVIG